MKRLFMRVLLLASTIAICASPAYSCSCPVHEVVGAFDQASAVFVGRVIQIEPPRTANPNAELKDRLFRIKFRVEKSWKGASTTEIEILSAHGSDCFAYPRVSKGERYLVYADPPFINGTHSKDLHMITICNRTAHLRVSWRNRGRTGPSQFDRRDGSGDIKILDDLIKGSRAQGMNPHAATPGLRATLGFSVTQGYEPVDPGNESDCQTREIETDALKKMLTLFLMPPQTPGLANFRSGPGNSYRPKPIVQTYPKVALRHP